MTTIKDQVSETKKQMRDLIDNQVYNRPYYHVFNGVYHHCFDQIRLTNRHVYDQLKEDLS